MVDLRGERERAGLTQARLAEFAGIAPSNLSAYESGRRPASAAMIARIRSAMTRPSDRLREKRHEVLTIITRNGGRNPRLFGSVARGDDTPASDLDIVVDVRPEDAWPLRLHPSRAVRAARRARRRRHRARVARQASRHPRRSRTAVNARTRRWLHDLVGHARAVERLVARGKSTYDADEMLRYAAEGLLIRLGECVNRIDRDDPGFVDAHPDLELRRVKDARHVVAHGYDVVDTELLWAILSTNVPQVAARVGRLVS